MGRHNAINLTITENDFSDNRTTAGTAVKTTVSHSDNTNAASHAYLAAVVAGANGGDAFLHLNVTGGQDYSFGIDNTSSDSLQINDDASPSTGNILWKMTVAGERTLPLQPAFFAFMSADKANATGNATVYKICDDNNSTVFDQGGDYDDDGVFTAPVTGRYEFNCVVRVEDISSAMTEGGCYFITTKLAYVIGRLQNAYVVRAQTAEVWGTTATAFVNMDAADTAYSVVMLRNGAGDTADVSGDANITYSGFNGCLVV